MQALLGFHDESRWIRHARKSLRQLFPYLPQQPGYNKRLRTLGTQMTHLIPVLATDTDLWQHPIRLADSTPVQCGTSRTTAQNSDLAGWAGYGYCASHSRQFWGLRLHLVTTVHGLPVAFALTNPKLDERDVLVDLVSLQPAMFHHRDGLILVVDKGYRDRATETWLGEAGITVVRPAYRNETPRPGRVLLRAGRPERQYQQQHVHDHGLLTTDRHRAGTDTVAARSCPARDSFRRKWALTLNQRMSIDRPP